jgi:alpha-L-rhamnosidase
VPSRKLRYGLPKDILANGSAVEHPTLYGDWLNVEAHTPHEIIRTAFYAYSTMLCRDAARLLGKTDDATAFEAEWQAIRADFQTEFLREDGRIVGRSSQVDSQTAYCLALHFDLLEPEQRQAAVDHLVADIAAHDGHLTTGFVGLPYLLPVLSRFGRSDICYQLLLKKTYPSWGYEIANGATSIWERWNGYHHEQGPGDPNMNSYAHYAYGAVCEWLFSDMAGIELLAEAFKVIRIRPRIGGGLSHAGASHQSIRGLIRSDWRLDGEHFTLEVEIPGNCRAEIHLPTTDAASIREGAQAVESHAAEEDGYRFVEVSAGSYAFSCRLG